MKKVKRYLTLENIIMLVIALVSAYMFFASGSFKKAQSKLFPQIISGGVFLCCAVGLVLNTVKKNKKEENTQTAAPEQKPEKSENTYNHYIVMGAAVLYILLLETLGFILSTLLELIAVPCLLGYKKWKIVVPVALVLSIGLYFLFKYVFYVSLPAGLLSFIL